MELAILGGKPVRTKPWPSYPILGEEEENVALEVIRGGRLVSFRASAGGFLGSERIRAFEQAVADYHNVEFAITFSSATAALHGAVVAVGVQPGDEVIVTPYSFNSSATCPLMHNAIPVFADVSPRDFCLNPRSIEKRITSRTRAIIPVHLFGGPAGMTEIMDIAHWHGLKVIEDAAQAPGAMYEDDLVGTIGDCGVFSFVGEKNASCGEGGMLITNNHEIARIARLIRNHGDALYKPMLGWNYRMTEIQAAIGLIQWNKLDQINQARAELAHYLCSKIRDIEGITTPYLWPERKHVYYAFPILYDEWEVGIHRDTFVNALVAEGIPVGAGYIRPLHLLPLFLQQAHYTYKHYDGNASDTYGMGACKIAERLSFEEMIITYVVRPPATTQDMDDIVTAIHKVLDHKEDLQWKSN
jgi:perosamine synthetase